LKFGIEKVKSILRWKMNFILKIIIGIGRKIKYKTRTQNFLGREGVPIVAHLRSLITKHFLRPSKNLENWHRKSKIDSAPENEFYFKNNNRDRKKNKI
jgi:hypothetical protein